MVPKDILIVSGFLVMKQTQKPLKASDKDGSVGSSQEVSCENVFLIEISVNDAA